MHLSRSSNQCQAVTQICYWLGQDVYKLESETGKVFERIYVVDLKRYQNREGALIYEDFQENTSSVPKRDRPKNVPKRAKFFIKKLAFSRCLFYGQFSSDWGRTFFILLEILFTFRISHSCNLRPHCYVLIRPVIFFLKKRFFKIAKYTKFPTK